MTQNSRERIEPHPSVRSLKLTAIALSGATLVVVGQFVVVSMLDAGLIRPYTRPYLAFYAATAVIPAILGTVVAGSFRQALATAAAAAGGTYVFYKLGVQTHRLTELGNSLDWAVVLIVTVVALIAPAVAASLRRRMR
jgi:predicted signal transduction protein with EAL and GGDEF domain